MIGCPMIMVYGAPWTQKTSTVFRAFPRAYWITTSADELAVIYDVRVNPDNRMPYEWRCLSEDRPIQQVTDHIRSVQSQIRSVNNPNAPYTALVIDNLTALASREAISVANEGVPDAYGKQQRALDDRVQRLVSFLEQVNATGTVICCIAHEQSPQPTDKKGPLPGGPMFPGKVLVKTVPVPFSIVVRLAVVSEGFDDDTVVLQCKPSTEYAGQKDRYGTAPAVQSPPDLGAIVKGAMARVRAVREAQSGKKV